MGRSTKLAIATVACFTAGVVAWQSSSTAVTAATSNSSPAAAEAAELYRKKLIYGPDYGDLLGGKNSALQKAWPGLTCDRTDDDKWGWAADAMAQPLDSGTNCVWGDTWFCDEHYTKTSSGHMSLVSQLMWNRCNSSCNATDEGRVEANGVDAHLVGKSGLAACQFEGLSDMEEVCTGLPEPFVKESVRRYLSAVKRIPENRRLRAEQLEDERRRLMNDLPPSVPHRNITNILINQSVSIDPCNTHAFCGACVDSDTQEVNKYCEANMLYYGHNKEIWAGGYAPELFFYNVHFWCQTYVLDAIEDGTFMDKVEAGDIPSFSDIDTAYTNDEAVRLYGSWKIPDDDAYQPNQLVSADDDPSTPQVNGGTMNDDISR
jgi:hypothetical protein